MDPWPLDEGGSVILGAGGAGNVQLGPRRPNIKWSVTTVALTVSTNVLEPVCIIYSHSTPVATFKLGGTWSGSNDGSDLPNPIILYPGQLMLARWTGGDVGAQATLSVYGTQEKYR